MGQGFAVAISADGNTAISTGPGDHSNYGAFWVYVRSGNTWTQQGPKVVGTGGSPSRYMGRAVALSADGNTAIVGSADSSSGDTRVFTRTGTTWTQQARLVGTGWIAIQGYPTYQGAALSISADGNTALVGGYGDNSSPGNAATGAVWVFVRSGTTWSQQGNKLVGTGAGQYETNQGTFVSLSANGNTALVGGAGVSWMYTRTGTTWSQLGAKLRGKSRGTLSADGNTAVVGDSLGIGVYDRTGNVWTKIGAPLVRTGGEVNTTYSPGVLTISGDGNTVMVGIPADSSDKGATWIFAKQGGTHTGINSPAAEAALELYPNPSDNTITISSTDFKNGYEGTISDMTGRVVMVLHEQSAGAPISVRSLASGTYLLHVTDGAHSAVRRLVRQ